MALSVLCGLELCFAAGVLNSRDASVKSVILTRLDTQCIRVVGYINVFSE